MPLADCLLGFYLGRVYLNRVAPADFFWSSQPVTVDCMAPPLRFISASISHAAAASRPHYKRKKTHLKNLFIIPNCDYYLKFHTIVNLL